MTQVRASKLNLHESKTNIRVLLFGSRGLLGQAITQRLSEVSKALDLAKSPSFSLKAMPREDVDIRSASSLKAAFDLHKPQLVINAAAYTQVDLAEKEHEQAFELNSHAVGNIAQLCYSNNVHLVHFSTDYVFSGEGQKPYVESDCCQPLNQYGASKLAGEIKIKDSGCSHWIFRTSWLYGANQGFAAMLTKALQQNRSMNIVNDQFGSPTCASDLADFVVEAIQNKRVLHSLRNSRRLKTSGVYNACCTEYCSWYQFALEVYSLFQGNKPDSCPFSPIQSKDYKCAAERPTNSRLDQEKLKNTFGHKLPTWQEALQKYLLNEASYC